jgi:hypothetical protein
MRPTSTITDGTRAVPGTFQFDLTDSAPRSLRGPLELRVVAGRAWITVSGDSDDWFLAPGERFAIAAGRHATLSGDPACRIAVSAALDPAAPIRPGARLRLQAQPPNSCGK